MWTGGNVLPVHNSDRLFEVGIYDMRIDLGDVKVIKVVNGIERPHTSAAGFTERGNRIPHVVEGRSFFPR
jgi:hypothetical protein